MAGGDEKTGAAGAQPSPREAMEALQVPNARPAEGRLSEEQAPAEPSDRPLPVEEQIANANVHLGSQKDPEVFDEAHGGGTRDEAPAPDPAMDQEAAVTGLEASAAAAAAQPVGSESGFLGAIRSLARNIFSSGSPQPDRAPEGAQFENNVGARGAGSDETTAGTTASNGAAGQTRTQAATEAAGSSEAAADDNNDPTALDVAYGGITEDGAAGTFAYAGADADPDDVLTYSVVVPPAEGSVVDNGDGTFTFDPGADFQDLAEGSTRQVSFTYQVDDGTGTPATATATITVTGSNDAPTATDVAYGGVDEDGAARTFAYDGADVDSGDTLTYSILTAPAEGSVVDNGDGTFTFDPGADFQDLAEGATRQVNFTYQVDDGTGTPATATATITVTGTNDDPTATDVAYGGVDEDGAAQTFAYDGADVDSGDTLTYSILTAPAEGSVVDNGDGTFSFDPGADFQDLAEGATRQVSFTYQVDDGTGTPATATATITVTGTNDDPTASDVAYGGVDEDGAARTFAYDGADVDTGDTLTYSILTAPAEGSVVDNGDGTFSFDPGAGFQDLAEGATRQVSFTYQVDDGTGTPATTTATITVTGSNDDPTATDVAYGGVDEDGTAQTFAYDGADVDTGDTLTYSILTVPAEGSVVDNGDGTFTFDPGAGFQDLAEGATRQVSFTYQADDGTGTPATATATITVTGTNDDPTASDVAYGGVDEDGAARTFAYDGADVDTGDTLTYSILTAPAEGSVVDNGDGTFTFDPGADFQNLAEGATRQVSFTYQVDDGTGTPATATATITVTGTNDDPTATDVAYGGVDEDGTAQTFAYDGADVDTGDTLAYSILTAPAEGSVVDNGDGTFSFDPGADFQDLAEGATRQVSFTYQVDDGTGTPATATATITVTGSNDDPTATDVAYGGVDEDGVAQTFAYDGADVDTGDTLTYSILTAPAEGSVVDNGDGTFSFDPGAGFQDLAEGATRQVSFTYQVDDGTGTPATATATITVTGSNDDPTASDVAYGGVDEDGAAQTFAYDGADVDTGDTLTYSILTAPAEGSVVDNGDGTFSFDPGADFQDLAEGATRQVSFTYRVDDGTGTPATATATITVTGTNDDPTASDVAYGGVDEDGTAQTFAYDGADVDTGDTLTYSILTAPAEGSVVDNGDGTFSFDPGADFQDLAEGATRQVSFTYQVDDGTGTPATATATITVTGTNDDPTASDVAYGGVDEDGTAQTFAYDGADVDTGDTLTYSILTAPAEGSVVDNGDGTFSFDPGADFQDLAEGATRQVSFTYQVDDGTGTPATATATITVTGTNDDPTASDVAYGGVDEDGTAQTFAYDGADVDTGDTLTYSILTAPAEGSVVDNGDGTFAFDPGADFQDLAEGATRQVSFTYQVDDGTGTPATATATITVTGSNDDPTASDVAYGGVDEDGTARTFAYDGADVDTGDILTYSILTAPAEGSVSDNGDGSFTFDPGAGFQDLAEGATRQVSFTYQVDDGTGTPATATATITVTGTNDDPTASDVAYGGVGEDGAAQTFAYDGADVDTGDTLTYSILTAPAEGSVVDNGDGTFSFDPGADFQDLAEGATRQVSFTYQVDDGTGTPATATATITVTGTNDDPTASDVAYGGVGEDGAAQTFAYDGADVDTGDTLTYSILTAPAEGSVVDNGDGTFSFDPGADFQDLAEGATRQVNFTYQVDDGTGTPATATATITVTGTNDDPTASDVAYGGVDEDGAAQTFAYDGADVDTGDTLTYSILTAPAEGSVVDNGDGTFSFDPGADFQDLAEGATRQVNFTYQVDDGTGTPATATATITVTGTNDDPTASDVAYGGVDEDGAAQTFAYDGADVDTGDTLTYSILTAPAEGSVVDNGDGTFSFDPGADFQDLAEGATRQVNFTYQVDDGTGTPATATATITVTGTNDDPTASDVAYGGVDEDGAAQTFAYDGADADSGDTLTYGILTAPAEGSVVDNGDGTFTFDPGADFQDLADGATRQVSFTYQVDDGTGTPATATATITVTGSNDDPTASDVAYGGVDEDGAAQTFAYDGADVDTGDVLTYSILTAPAEGSVVDNGDGTFSFDPGADFQDLAEGATRQVSFAYQADDGTGTPATATATITVTGTNDDPTASDVAYGGVDEDGAAQTFAYDGADVDTGDVLTYSILTAPAEGSVVDNGDGTFSFDPGADFQDLAEGATRQVSFAYQADDGTGTPATATATITVTGTNDDPTASDVAYGGVDEDGAARTFAYDGADVDTGDTLTYSILTAPAEGSVVDNGDGSFTFDPGADFQDLAEGATRQVSFTYQVDDGTGTPATATATITVTGTNDDPTASDVAYGGVDEDGAARTFAYDGADPDTGDTLTYSILTAPAEGSVVDNGDGTFTFDPGADFQDLAEGATRQVSFTYQVDDGTGTPATATATITVTGTNDDPTASDVAYGGVDEDGAAQTFAYDGADVDSGDTLTYGILTAPAEGSVVDNGDGTFSFDPGADFQDLAEGATRQVSFTYQADDGTGTPATATVTITVTGTNDDPTASDVAYGGVDEDGVARTFAYDGADVDTGDTLTYSILTAPAEGSVVDNGDGTFTFDPGAGFQDLAEGATRQVSFTYQVDDGTGTPATATATITVTGTNDNPTASDVAYGGVDEDGAAQTFAYDGADADTGDTLTYSILTAPAEGSVADNGDGTFSFDPGADFQDLAEGSTRQVSFTYQVDDGTGTPATATATITVTGSNDDPTATDVAYGGVDEDGAARTFAYDGADVDTGDTLTYSILTAPAEGSVSDNGDGTFSFDPGADFQDLAEGATRQVSFTYQVDDGTGTPATATATITVTGSNDDPTATDVAYGGVDEDGAAQTFAYDGADVDTGDTLTYSILTAPAEGSVSDNGDGTFSFDPGADFQDLAEGATRQVSFTYQVDDGTGTPATATATITVTGSNDDPTATDVAYGGVDEDGTAQTFAYDGADVDTGDTLTYSILTAPAEGSVVDNGDGTFSFDPGADFQDLAEGATRQVSFTYQVDDGTGTPVTATATITVTGSNDDPTASDVAYGGVDEDGAAQTFAYGGADVDAGDTLTYSILTAPAEGSVVDNGDGTFSFDPGADFQDLAEGATRQVSFTYQVDDGTGTPATATATITVTGSNDDPTASDVAYGGVDEDGTAQTFAYDGADADTGDTLTYSILTAPAEGSVVDNGDGTFSFDPGADFQDLAEGATRQVSFTYQVDDGTGTPATATATITVTGSNDDPTASDVAYGGVDEDGTAQTFAYDGADADTGDTLTYSILTAPAEGSVVDNGDGTFSFDPGADFQDLAEGATRQVSFTYQVDDGTGTPATATATITVTGSNDDPTASDVAYGGVDEDGTAQTFAYDGADADTGDTLTYSILTAPAEGSVVDNGDGTFTFDPGADFQNLAEGATRQVSFTYQVDDGTGTPATATATITVTGTNDDPTATDVAYGGVDEDGAAQTFAYDGADVDTGDTLTYSILTAPAEGSVVDNGDGTFTFDPGADFQDLAEDATRQVSFTYQVDDGTGTPATATATITVTGTNDDPTASDVAYGGVDEDGAAQTFAYDGADVDTGDTLTYSILTAPAEGSVVDNGDGTFSFDPGADFQDLAEGATRQVSFTYQVDDGTGTPATATATITVTGTNDDPTATDVAYGGVDEDGTAQTFAYDGADVDSGDTLTYSILTAPAEGSVVDNGDGTFTFDPGTDFQDLAEGATRQVSFTYQVDDGAGTPATATATITVTGTNDDPTATDVAYGGVDEDGTAQTFAYDGADVDTGDVLTYSILTAPAEGSVSDNGDGTFTFNPGADFQDLAEGATRQVSFTYQVDDGTGTPATATATITVTGTNDDPTASDVAYGGVDEDGAAQTFAYDGADVDTGDTLTYSILTAPAEGSVVDNGDGTFAFDPGADFQDLAEGATRQVSFTYQVDDGTGTPATATATITVTGTNDDPTATDVAYGGVDEDGAAQTFAYDGADVDTGDTLTYSILTAPAEGSVVDNGDGTFTFDPGADFQDLAEGATRQVSFTYQVDDGTGTPATATATITVTGTNDDPTASDVAYGGVDEDGADQTFAYDGADVDTGDTLTYSILTAPAEGSVVDNGDGTFSFDPGADFQDLAEGATRQVSFTYQVDDGTGTPATATATITVTGTNDDPTASDVAYGGVDEDGAAQTFAYDGADVDSGDTLTYSILTAPAEGSVVDNGDGTFSFDPGADFQDLAEGATRQVSFTYRVDDGTGTPGTATATITVTGTNDDPTASDVAYGGVDEDGAAQTFAYDGADVDSGDTLTYSILTAPAEGSVADNGDGTFTFDPGAGFQDLAEGATRQVSFTYQVDDGTGTPATATATITVTGTNDDPTATDVAYGGVDEDGTAQTFAYDGADVDTGDTLTYSILTAPAEGSVVDNGDGTFTFDPGADFQDLAEGATRQVSFTYQVDDGTGTPATATATITVTGSNDDPTATDVAYGGVDEDGTAQTFAYDGADVDSGDTLTYSILTAPAEGSVVDNGDGTFSFDPGADFQDLAEGATRQVSFTYQVDDGTGTPATATATITVTGSNDDPTATDVAYGGVDEDGTARTFAYDGADVDTGDVLTYSILTAPAEGSVVDNGDGTFSFDPGADFQDLAEGATRQVSFTYQVDDGTGTPATATATITVTGTNDDPTASDVAYGGVDEDGAAQTFAYDGADVDSGDTLTYSILTAPAEGSVADNGDGTFSFDPGADFQDLAEGATRQVSFTYQVDDGTGTPATATATITVTGTNDDPTASDVAYGGVDEDGAAQTFAYDGADADTGDTLTYSILTAPGEGSVVDNGDGTFSFDPGADFQDLAEGATRQVSFTYQVDDGTGTPATATAAITVTGSNDDPTASDVAYGGIDEDGAAQTFAYDGADADTGDTLTYGILTAPAEGSVVDNGDGTFTFDPGADFQDLAEGATRQVSFTYQVDDGTGTPATATATITVTGTNDDPTATDVAYGGVDEDGAAQTFAYDGADADTGDTLTYSILTAPAEGSVVDNGDGTFTFDPGADFQDLAEGATRQVSFTYQVDDGTGTPATATATITVTGTNDDPTASDVAYGGVDEDGAAQTFAYDGADADTGDTLTYGILTAPAEGSVADNGDGTFTFDPGADFQDLAEGATRQVSFTYQVDDGTGTPATATATITVTGTNDDPTATDVAYGGVDEDGTAQTFAYDGADVDTGDTLTYSILTAPAEGSVVDNGDGTFSFDPGAGFQDLAEGATRQVSFTYQVDDGTGTPATATAIITVTGTNDDPTASDVAYGGVDEDGTARTFAYDGADADTGDTLTYSILTAPAEGSVSDNGDGTFSFDPGADFQDLAEGATRQVSFTYQVDDGTGTPATATATITVTGTNDDPTATDVTYGGVDEDGAAQTFAYDGADVDSGDTLTYSILTAPAEGSVVDNGDGTFSFDPGVDFQDLAEGATRQVSFTYQVDDGTGTPATATATITVTGTNDDPTATDVAYGGVDEDGAARTFAYDGADVDSGDTLTYSILTAPAEGSVADNGDGTFSFDPGADFQDLAEGATRQVSFTYQVDDGTGTPTTATATITVTGTNDDPTATDMAYGGVDEDGAARTFAYDGADADTGDTLTYSILTAPAEGSVSDNGDGTFTFDPGAGFQDLAEGATRQVSFTYQVDDGTGTPATATATITVTGSNDNPTATDVAYGGVDEDGAARTFAYDGADADTGDTLTYSILTAPAEGSAVDNGDGTFSFDPGADFQDLAEGATRQVSFTYQVDDGTGTPATATATITVTGTNDDPTATDVAYGGVDEDGTAQTFAYDGADADTGGILTYSILTAPAEGSVSDNGDGTFSFDPGAGFQDLAEGATRQVSFTYQVDDGTGTPATATATITVTGTNDDPTASDVAYGGVDEDGAAQTFAYDGADVDTGDTLTYSILTAPAEGSVVDNGDGTFTFDPGADFQDLAEGATRQVSFTYQVDDGTGTPATATATITVTGSNDDPTDISLSNNTVAEYSPAGIVVGTLSAVDPDAGETFTYAITGGDTDKFEIDGDQVVVKAGAGLDYETATSHQIDVEVTDSGGNSYTETLTIGVEDLNEITGNNNKNTLVGADTADYIWGGGDSDDLDGQGGDDILAGGSGSDTLRGGDGDDIISGGEVSGSGKNSEIGGDDTLYGEAGDDILYGDDGDDTLDGGIGSDTLEGGDGDDILTAGDDDDTLSGGAGDDTLSGDDGADLLEGDAGADSLDGGTGIDTATYASSDQAVVIDLAAGTASGGDADGDSFTSIENLIGSDYDDTLQGDGGDNELTGGDGSDLFIFTEGGGDDLVHGGTGGGWTDVLELQDSGGGAPTAGWTYTLTEGTVESSGADFLDLSEDAAGTITLVDGSEVAFEGIERIEW